MLGPDLIRRFGEFARLERRRRRKGEGEGGRSKREKERKRERAASRPFRLNGWEHLPR